MKLQTPKEMAMSAAERFRMLRKQKDVSIKKLSEMSGVPYSTVRRFESTGEISFLALIKMASALNEDGQIEELFAAYLPSTIEEVIRANSR